MLYIKKDCTNDSIARPWKSDEKDIVFLEKWLNPGSIHSEMMNLKDCIDQSKSPVEILSAFMSNHPEKVPRTPYLSVFIAFATSLAVTKPI